MSKGTFQLLHSHLQERFKDVGCHHGKRPSYLGQMFDFTTPCKVKATMAHYVADILREYVEGDATSSVRFYIDTSTPQLSLSGDEAMYLARRVRPDILITTSFLYTRTMKATREDDDKLGRAMRYINSTQELGMIIDAHLGVRVIAYVNASYAVHADFKSIFVKSSKQKINTKSSTEAELVGVSDALSQIIWTRDFLLEQGHDVLPVELKQDNMSAITMASNGRSTSEKTRHIGTRFFFIKDRVDQGELRIEPP
jgi:hypothetical protein